MLIPQVLRETALKYPRPLIEAQLIDIPRVAFHIRLVRRAVGDRAAVCDIGGGIGMFSPACATLGMKVTLADDFHEGPSDTLRVHRDLGVAITSRDAAFPPNCFDAITAFDSDSNSDAALSLESLRPGGVFIMSIPNERPRSVATLRSLAKALYLRRVRIVGRNWTVRRRYLYRLADHILRLHPSLCANLYLIGHK